MAKDDKGAQFGGFSFDQVKELIAAGMSLEQIESLGNAGFSFQQVAELSLASAPKPQPQMNNLGLTKEDMAELLDAQRKAINPSNPTHPGISAFSYPEGERKRAKPQLDRETYFCGSRQREEQLRPEEIDAFNTLTESCEIPEKGEYWYVKVTPKRREVVVPAADRDQLGDLPGGPNGLLLIINEFKYGSKAVDPLELTKRLKAAEERVMELEERLTSPLA